MLNKNKKLKVVILSAFLLVMTFGLANSVFAKDTRTSEQIAIEKKCVRENPYIPSAGSTGADYSKDSRYIANQAKIQKCIDAAGGDSSNYSPPSTSTEGSIANVIGWIFFYIAQFFGWLVHLMIQVMVSVASYNHFLDTKIVTSGWVIVRDIANNFFIIILLVISVGTILQVPNYNRQLLPKLLIMAILINFSKMFTGILIDFSQVITLWFAGAINGVGNQGNILLYALGLTDLFNIDPNQYSWKDKIPSIEEGDVIRSMLFAVILSVVAAVVISMITIILVYRIVMLWFLVILSPLAYLLSTFPKGQQYASQWWSELAKYLVVGPVMLFFLYLSLFSGAVNVENPSLDTSITGQTSAIDSSKFDGLTGTPEERLKTLNTGLTRKQSPPEVFDFLIIIGLMVGSLVAGQKTGAAGGQWAGKGISALQKMGKKATIGTALGTARLADRKAGISQKVLNAGASRIPLIRTALGQRVTGLNAETTKLEQGKIAAASATLSGKGTAELMKLSENQGIGNKYNRIAAAQKLAEKGELRDDKDLNPVENKRRVDIINRARKDLSATPELQGVLDDNIRKNAPALAMASDMYKKNDGSFNMDKIGKDARDGKLNMGSALSGASASDLANIKGATGGQDDSIAKFLLNNITDKKVLSSTFKDLSGDNREKVLGGVNQKTFIKNDGSGKVDTEKRADFLKAADHANITKVFNKHNDDDRQMYDQHYEANKSDIKKNISSKEVQQLANDMSHIMGQKDIDDLKAKGKDFKEAVTKGLEAAINEISFNDYSNPDKRNEIKKKYENGLLGGAEFDMTDGQNIDHEILGEALGGKNKKAMLENMNAKNINQDFITASHKQLKPADYQTIAGVSADNKKTLQSAFASTISSANPLTTDGKDMISKLMTQSSSIGGEIDYKGGGLARSDERKKVFEGSVVQGLSADSLRNGKFNDTPGQSQILAIAKNGDINAIKSFFRDPGSNIDFAQKLAKEIKSLGGSREAKLEDYL